MRAASILLISFGLFTNCAEAAEPRPNIILVFIDDLGWGDFSCFGNRDARTPNIDRLAAEGIRFSQFYVNSPICSPSRVAITTGQYPQRWRITSFLNNRAENEKRGMANWLDPNAPLLPRLLQQNGYATGHFGKWHMGGQRDVGEAPLITDYGFEESLTNFEGLGPRLLGLCDPHDGRPPRRHALGSDKLGRGPVIWYDRSRLTAGYTKAAIAFLNKARDDGRPFYVNLWPDDVHSPFFPPEAKRGDGSKRALYHGVLETMDQQLGVLFDHVRRDSNLRDNTMILVCSDNGPEPGAGSAGPFRGTKATLYEGGIRSPLIAWGPGLIAAGAVGDRNETSVFSAMDLVPSLLTITGSKLPQDVVFDGQDIADTLLGRKTASRTAPLHWRRPPDRKSIGTMNAAVQPDLAIRDGTWKLLCEYDGTKPKLYELTQDPAETTDLARRHPEVVQRLTAAILAWHQSMPPDKGPSYARTGADRSRK